MKYSDNRFVRSSYRLILPSHLHEILVNTTRWVARTLERRAKQVRHRRDIAKLRELPDYMLKDIGVMRGDIEHVVCFGGRLAQHSAAGIFEKPSSRPRIGSERRPPVRLENTRLAGAR